MKFILSLLITVLLGFIVGLFMPWWSIALAAFSAALLIPQSPARSFLAGFLGLFILWLLVASWLDVANDHLLSTKIAQLFPLGGSSLLLLLITALIGALVGGFAAMSGSSLRNLIQGNHSGFLK